MGKNYMEIASYGRGAGSQTPYFVSFEVKVKYSDITESVRALSTKSGLAIKKINGGGKALSGFVSLDDLNVMFRKIPVAIERLLDAAPGDTQASEAEYVFKMGSLKGKTPSQALKEGIAADVLLQQKAFLEKNASGKWAAQNLKGAKDIEKAIEAQKNGTLDDLANASAGVKGIVLYKSGPRYFPKKQAQPYETEGWELEITAYPGNKNPFSIEWQNKTVTIRDNMIVAAKDVKREQAALTESEFIDAISAAEEILKNAEIIQTKKRLDYFEEHKDDWKGKTA